MNNTESGKSVLTANLKKYTQMNAVQIREIVEHVPMTEYKKRTVLLQQGFAPKCSYYLIKGCVRQYACNESGNEATVNFFTEEESINLFSFLDDDGLSLYSLACLEDCLVVECPDIGNNAAGDEQPDIGNMKRLFFEKQFSDMQVSFTKFKFGTAEERFAFLVKSRPALLNRVPQIYLASYLGIAPETFSRFKKRMKP